MPETLPTPEARFSVSGAAERIVGRTWQALRGLFTMPKSSTPGIMNRIGEAPGHFAENAVRETANLTGDAIGGIAKFTWRSICSVLGGAGRLTGKAVGNAPVLPMPI